MRSGMKLIYAAILGFVLTGKSYAVAEVRYGITFGPVLNWSFGETGNKFFYGANIAYWDFRGGIPWSIGFGYEGSNSFENLIYSELQSGAWLYGASAGAVYSNKHGFGGQASVWGNFFGGLNLRTRYLNKGFHFVPGLYLSIPVMKIDGNFG